jgi:hypothetical protein
MYGSKKDNNFIQTNSNLIILDFFEINLINFCNIIAITRRFQVLPKISENINPRKEGAIFLRESASLLLVECFSSFLMFSVTDLYLFFYDLKAARNIIIIIIIIIFSYIGMIGMLVLGGDIHFVLPSLTNCDNDDDDDIDNNYHKNYIDNDICIFALFGEHLTIIIRVLKNGYH